MVFIPVFITSFDITKPKQREREREKEREREREREREVEVGGEERERWIQRD